MEISRRLSRCECGSHGGKKKGGAKQEDQQVVEQDREHEDDRRAHGRGGEHEEEMQGPDVRNSGPLPFHSNTLRLCAFAKSCD